MTRSRSLARHALLAALTIGAVVGHGAIAQAEEPGCSTRTSRQAFSRWGDTNQYFVATGGTFEAGATGWSFSGSPSVVTDQAPWKVNGSTHGKALRLPAASRATTTTLCVKSNEESMRFFYKAPAVAGAGLKLTIRTQNEYGSSVNTWAVGTSTPGWQVSPQIQLPNLRDSAGRQWITITFEPINNQATWVVDDVMIDPWVAR
jgi:hypothetical protein